MNHGFRFLRRSPAGQITKFSNLFSLWLVLTCAKVVFDTATARGNGKPAQLQTRVSIDGSRWLINGRPTHPGSPAEGLLMNVRMVNATFEDRNRPDFNADANTGEFLNRLTDYIAAGTTAFTLNLQGGMPGYEGAVNSAFIPDGSLRPEYLHRVERVIRACDRDRAVVILGLFYQRQSKVLRDDSAVRAGVVNAVRWVQTNGFQNVVIEIANEFPHGGFVHSIIRDPKSLAGLIRLAHETAPGLLVSSSGVGDGHAAREVAEVADFLLVHWNGTKISDIAERIDALRKFGKPIVCNEDNRTGPEAVEVMKDAVNHGAGYGLMLEAHNQHFPFHFDGRADDPVYYDALKLLTTVPANSK